MSSPNNTTTKATIQSNAPQYFNRNGKPFEKSTREVGFRISDFSPPVPTLGEENQAEVGWFISFYHNGASVRYVRDIRIYSVRVKPLDPMIGPVAKQYAGEVELQELPVLVEPLFASHHNSVGDFASFEETRAQPPVLRLNANGAQDALLTDLRGYDEAVKIAFLDVETLRQINLAIDFASEDQPFEIFFSGAAVNYGEMASPHNQHLRFKETEENSPDPSISFVLKAEALFQTAESSEIYASANLAEKMFAGDDQIMLPGLFLLDTCKTYWRKPTSLSSALALI